MSKKALFERMKNAVDNVRSLAKYNGRTDWGFAPVITDGKVNVGYKRSPMSIEEMYGTDALEGMQGPVDANKYYKYQYISPKGDISRTAVMNGSAWRTSGNDPWGKNPRLMGSSLRSEEKRGGWGKDLEGNFYNLDNDNVEVPLPIARDMKKNLDGFEYTDMRGSKNETRTADFDARKALQYEARRDANRTANDPLAENDAYTGNTNFMAKTKYKLFDKDMEATRAAGKEAYADVAEKRAALQAQIEELKKQMGELDMPWEAEDKIVREGAKSARYGYMFRK